MCVTYTRLLLFKRHLNLLWRRLSYRFFNNFITDWCRVRLKTYFQATSTKFLSCWLHHKLRLQRPLTTKLMAQLHCPKRRRSAFRQPRQPNPAADYRVQTWCIGTLNPYPCPRERQSSGNRLPIRLQRQPYRHRPARRQTNQLPETFAKLNNYKLLNVKKISHPYSLVMAYFKVTGTPTGNRTPVTAVKGRCPNR